MRRLVVADGVIAKGMRQYSKEVYALNQRFAAMQGVEEVTDEQNPVAGNDEIRKKLQAVIDSMPSEGQKIFKANKS